MEYSAIGIDLGGTNLKGTIISKSGEGRHLTRIPTEAEKGGAQVMHNILQLIEQLIEKEGSTDSILGVGIGTPGFVSEDGTVDGAENLPGWKGTRLYDPIMEKFNLKAVGANDATVAALAEARFGAGRGVRNMVLLTLGTGIGGGIVMAPLLLYVPPWFGFEPLTMRTVAGLTIVQGLAACISGALTHHRFRVVSDRLVLTMGTTIFAAAALGGASARFVSEQVLLAVFGSLAAIAAILMLVPIRQDSEQLKVNDLGFSRGRAVASAAGVGLLGGLVGQGGSFILIPLMILLILVIVFPEFVLFLPRWITPQFL